jgi:hypothetical protein
MSGSFSNIISTIFRWFYAFCKTPGERNRSPEGSLSLYCSKREEP